jgi:hypothetical protein
MFKRNGVYFLLTSGATGWSPNQQRYGTATSVTGTWSGLKDLGDATSYRSQTAYVLPVQGSAGTDYLYLGDRWGNATGGTVNDSTYVWLPLEFPTSTTMTMEYSPRITIDAATGSVTGMDGPWQTLTAAHSGKCADVSGFSMAESAPLVQYGCGTGVNQQFRLDDAGSGYVRIMARHSGKCVAVSGSSRVDGAKAVQNTCGGDVTAQQWKAEAAVGGAVRLVARHSGKCLDVRDVSGADGAALQQWTCDSGAANQRWQRTTV